MHHPISPASERTSITLASNQTLPKICASSGGDGATVRMFEDITYGPKWIYWFLLVPMGLWVTLALQMMTQRRMGITYFLTPEAHKRLGSQRRIKTFLILASLLSIGLPIYFQQPILWLVTLVLFPFTIWYEQKFQWPFVVESFTPSTLTIGRLPSSLVTAYEEAIASRRPKSPMARQAP